MEQATMNRPFLSQLARLATLCFLTAAVLMFSANKAAWATPAQSPSGATVPTKTPTASPSATATATPTSSPGATATPTPTPLPGVTPTETPAPLPACLPRPADPLPGSPRSVRAPVGPGGDQRIENCPWSIFVSGSAFTSTGTLEIQVLAASSSQAPNSGDIFFGPHADVTLFDSAGNRIAHPTFTNPIDLCYTYTADEAAQAGDAANLVIQTFDTSSSQWIAQPTRLDAANSRVCASLTHLSLFAVAARVPVPGTLPVTGGGEAGALILWLGVAIILALGGATMVSTRQDKRK
jgi:hypothetical protein